MHVRQELAYFRAVRRSGVFLRFSWQQVTMLAGLPLSSPRNLLSRSATGLGQGIPWRDRYAIRFR